MDFLERLNRRFGGAYERLIGGAGQGDGELRPKDILRRILVAMEDGRREGLDGQVYVPNAYALHIAISNDEERQYLLTFLDAEELGAAVRRAIDQHGYKTKGGLHFAIEEAAEPGDALAETRERVRIVCRFDPSIPQEAKAGTPAVLPVVAPPVPAKAPPLPRVAPVIAPAAVAPVAPSDDHELGTIPAGVGGVPLATLLIRGGDGRNDAVPLTARGLAVGRGKQSGNDVVLADGMVSKRHVRFVYDNGAFAVQDENSTNGTFLNGERLAPGVFRPIAFGNEVRVGETLLTLQSVSQNNGPAPNGAAFKPTSGGYRLVAGDGETFRLASDMTVGRALTCDLHILGSGVADKHARFRVSPGGDSLTLEDLESATGTFVNGERVPPRYAITIYDGDQIALGDVLLRVERTRAA